MAADSHPTKRRKKSTPSSSRLKEEHYDKFNAAIEHYKRYIGITDNDDDDDNEEEECGDIDEILEVIEILSELVDDGIITPFEMSCETADVAVNASIFGSIHSILPILMSMSYLHIANHSMSVEDLDDIDDDDNQQPPMYYFDESLRYWSTNPAANSLLADYYRQHDDLYSIDMTTICNLYVKASTCAGKVKDAALRYFNNTQEEDDDNACFNLKELIDILIISGALGMDMDEQDDEEEMEDGDEDDEDDDEQAVDSSSTVEETSSFTAAMLLSSIGKHDDAKLLLQKFRFSHRIHPNVWSLASGQELLDNRSKQMIGDKTALFQPRMYHSKDGGVLPQEYYDRLCELFAPDAPYWEQSGYDTRGYYSYYFDVKSSKSQGNVVEDAIVNHLLPLAEQTLREEHKSPPPKIVGCEWWIHTRPRAANLGHPLHFDTDEWLLNNNHEVSHPIISSVLYLTGGEGSGSTIVFDQTPNSRENASRAWVSEPKNNQFMNFPGNLLHGVLPCASDCNSSGSDSNRLTLMVGFWTRQVTKDIKRHEEFYVPCGPLPPAIEAHSWVLEAQNIVKKQTSQRRSLETTTLKVTSPAWEAINHSNYKEEKVSLQVPKTLDHQYFVRNAPKCFSDKLFRSHNNN
jgi:hypothetical protein